MKMRFTLAGTGLEGREQIIRRHCHEGIKVRLVREPKNEHDPNAIAVYLIVGILPFFRSPMMIGYVNAVRASTLHARLDAGERPTAAYVAKCYAPPDLEFPSVSVEIQFEPMR